MNGIEEIIGFVITVLAMLFYFRKKPAPNPLTEAEKAERRKLKQVLESYGLTLEGEDEDENQVRDVVRAEKTAPPQPPAPAHPSFKLDKHDSTNWGGVAQPESAIEAYRIHEERDSYAHQAVGQILSSRSNLRGTLILGEVLGKPRGF